jgi:hypothetical protein
MRRASWLMALIAGAAIAVGYSWLYVPTLSAAASSGATNSTRVVEAQSSNTPASASSTDIQPALLPVPPETTVEQWLADAVDADPEKRRTAIAALANAQSEQVVPTLENILIHGEPKIDRPLALSSLRALAMVQGDIDGGIRNALRHAVYDGSDDAITRSAQATLEEVEMFFDHGVTKPSRR